MNSHALIVKAREDLKEAYLKDINDYTLTELINILEDSPETIPPRRGLKDKTYKRILYNKIINDMRRMPLYEECDKKRCIRYSIKNGVNIECLMTLTHSNT